MTVELLAELLHDQWKASGLTQEEFAAHRYQVSANAFRLWLGGDHLSGYVAFLEGMRASGAELRAEDGAGHHGSPEPPNQACAEPLP